MKTILPLLIIGIAAGSVYGLAGMGLVVTYRISGIFNFAHGAQAAAAAYIFYEFRDHHGMPWVLAALLSVALAGVLGGLLLERIAFALEDASVASRIVAAVGLLILVQQAIVLRYGATTILIDPFLSTRTIRFPGVYVGVNQLVVAGLALGAAVSFYVFFRRARMGAAMQAVVQDSGLLALQGVNPVVVRRLAWSVGASFAAVSGILLAPDIGLDPVILTMLVVQAFGAAAVGGFNSLVGTYFGGLVVGIASALLGHYLPQDNRVFAGLPANVPFIVLVAVLLALPKHRLFEPSGGRRLRRIVSAPFIPTTRHRQVLTGLAAVVLLAIPHVVGTKLVLYMSGLSFVVLFASLGLLVRTSGQLSLCHMAFAAVGSATFARAVDAGVPWPLALLVGGLVAVPVGAAVAIPAIRLSGVYLAIATFGFGLLLQRLFYQTSLLFGSSINLPAPRPSLPALHVGTDTGYYYVMLAVTFICLAGIVHVQRSRLGRLLRGLADSPVALSAHGANVNRIRLAVFMISAFAAGISGAMLGPVTKSASGLSFDFSVSLVLVAVLWISGTRGSVVPAFIGAILYTVVPGYITSSNLNQYVTLVFGATAIVVAVIPGIPALRRWPPAASKRTLERRGRSPVQSRLPATVSVEAAT